MPVQRKQQKQQEPQESAQTLLSRIREELATRIEYLLPAVDEYNRLVEIAEKLDKVATDE